MTAEELWKKKVALVKLLNTTDYIGAINYMIENLDNLDVQFCEMFICGFDASLSKKIPDELVKKIDSLADGITSFREGFRWEIIKNIIKGDLELNDVKCPNL